MPIICPLTFNKQILVCRKDCAFFDDKKHQCAMITISESLVKIADNTKKTDTK